MAHPVSPRLRIHIAEAAMAEDIAVVRDGTYVCMEGPQFSTLAESLTYKNLGYSVIGMTNMPEAKLAREAEICYATVAMVTDFDCWHPDHDAVTVQDIIKVLVANAEKAKQPGGASGARFSARARAVPDRFRPRARQCHDHRARSARSGTFTEARRRRRADPASKINWVARHRSNGVFVTFAPRTRRGRLTPTLSRRAGRRAHLPLIHNSASADSALWLAIPLPRAGRGSG